MSTEAMLGVYWTAITVVCFSVAGVSGSKIIDGFEAVPHSRPYMAQLKITKGNQLYNCGAFLIRRNVLLTAAHCHGENIMAQLGGHNRDRNEASRQEIAVKKMIPHENYDRQNAKNDIMLLQLERNVMITPEVQPIKLSTDCADNLPGMPCSVAGWGRTFTGGPGSDVLREVDVTILNICQYEQFNNLMWTVICARGSGIKGACNGDSGGPLVCRNGWNEPLAVGIVSLRNTAECENPNREDVYTNICMFWPWIKMKFSAIAAE
ncbi:mast cell protease 1A-like isoform X1 [Erpetoichthys calabaricus]|uniref:mast cell protease 1A-like isoform X1 n=1 Tax=Erpetoichthys calabaricus TaxID=27687 RepID=UPI00223445EE|nr:mast cell protease 1A-like isoform X1 [Erpetoichthys calabaricus]